MGTLGEPPENPPRTPEDAIAAFAGFAGLPDSLREPLVAIAEDPQAGGAESRAGQTLQFEETPKEGKVYVGVDGERAVTIDVAAWDTGGYAVSGLTYCTDYFEGVGNE